MVILMNSVFLGISSDLACMHPSLMTKGAYWQHALLYDLHREAEPEYGILMILPCALNAQGLLYRQY